MIKEQPVDRSETSQSNSDLRSFVNLVIDGRYITQKLIGEGGWSAVYLAFDRVLHRDVAIKLMHRPLTASSDNLERFEREARTASTLNHANIAAIYDYGVLPSGQPYMVMEHLVGETLAERIEKRSATSENEAIEIISQIASALRHAHQKGILHRDIKPSNIFLVSDDTDKSKTLSVKLLDFGLAKWLEDDKITTLTDSGTALGTPSYMSPEQCQRRAVDCRTDIYSLGCTMYELLSGAKPFQGSVMDCMHGHLLEEPPPMRAHPHAIDVSPSLEIVVRKSMAKNPERRISTADAFLAALASASHQKENSLLPLWWEISHSFSRLRKVWLPLAACAGFIFIAYYAGPTLLPLVGVRTVEVDAAKVDPRVLDEAVKSMAKTGRLAVGSDSVDKAATAK